MLLRKISTPDVQVRKLTVPSTVDDVRPRAHRVIVVNADVSGKVPSALRSVGLVDRLAMRTWRAAGTGRTRIR